jgi:hypothetical protein
MMVSLKHSKATRMIERENGVKKAKKKSKHFCLKCASAFKRTKTYKRWLSKVGKESTKKRSKRTRRCTICKQRVNMAKVFKYLEKRKHQINKEEPATQDRMQLLLQFMQLNIQS